MDRSLSLSLYTAGWQRQGGVQGITATGITAADMMWKKKERGNSGEKSVEGAGGEWGREEDRTEREMRPGRLLVRKRCPVEGASSSSTTIPASMVQVPVAYGG